MKINIVNGSPELIGWLSLKLGGTVCVRRPRTKRHRFTWQWTVMQERAAELLRVVRPYLIAKVRQADIAIAFMDGFVDSRGGAGVSDAENERRERLCAQIQFLNRRPGADATRDLVPIIPPGMASGAPASGDWKSLAEAPLPYVA